MPVDKPKAGESKEDYLNYCIPIEVESGKEVDVATAICISYYDKDKMSSNKERLQKLKELIKSNIR